MKQYQRIQQYILDGIARGRWVAGQRLPSENELAKLHTTSRMTVRRALETLTNQGIITRVQGAGTFVSANRTLALAQPIEDLATLVRRAGKSHHHQVIRHDAATPDECSSPGLPDNTPMALTEIIHFVDDLAVQYERRWTSLSLLPDFLEQTFDDIDASQYLLKHLPISRAWQRISAIAMPDDVTQALTSQPKTPCLLVERMTWSGERWATYVQLFHPGDRFQLEAELNMENHHVKP